MLRSRTIQGDDVFSTICDQELVRKLSRKNELCCPNCHNFVVYKKGPKMIAHFAHKPSTECVVSNYEKETVEHLKGKQVLFSWLNARFSNDALVGLEEYIVATEQIADILVTHHEGKFQGQRWAFEFQHSPISEAEWKRRHELYQKAGILDFWIFDAAIFLQYSKAQDVEKARRFRDPLKNVFDNTGFTYFLDLVTEELTVDCKFYVRWIEKRISVRGGMTVKNDYTFHEPEDHSDRLDAANFLYHEETRLVAIYLDKIQEQFQGKFEELIRIIENEKSLLIIEKRRERFEEIISYCFANVSAKFAHVLSSFCLSNKGFVVNDLLDMDIPAFIDKYRSYVEKIVHFLGEIELIRESDKVIDKVVADLAPRYHQYQFLDEQDLDTMYNRIGDMYKMELVENSDSFSLVLYERYDKEIKNVEYVLERYTDVLEQLLPLNQKSLENNLIKINWRLAKNYKEPSVIGFALGYAHCTSFEEIDEFVGRVKDEIVDYDPFSGFR